MYRLLFFIAVFCTFAAHGQDTLLLLSGRTLVVTSVDVQPEKIAYRTNDPKKKLKTINPSRVFSVKFSDGKETIVYQPDTLDPLEFKTEEMRLFIKGETDARSVYKNHLVKGFGVAVGVPAAGLLGFYGVVVPPLYATVLGSFSVNMERILTIKVGGDAAAELGLTKGKYLNEISGTKSEPVIKKDQVLKLSGRHYTFKEDATLSQVVDKINEKKECSGITAVNQEGKLKLYKARSTELINDNIYREGFEKRVREYKIRNGMLAALIGFVGSITVATILD